jgi:signal recognition particle GTPase
MTQDQKKIPKTTIRTMLNPSLDKIFEKLLKQDVKFNTASKIAAILRARENTLKLFLDKKNEVTKAAYDKYSNNTELSEEEKNQRAQEDIAATMTVWAQTELSGIKLLSRQEAESLVLTTEEHLLFAEMFVEGGLFGS